MINPELFYKILKKNGIGFFTGVPDSILKGFNNYLADSLKESIRPSYLGNSTSNIQKLGSDSEKKCQNTGTTHIPTPKGFL